MQQTGKKVLRDKARMSRKGSPVGNVQKIEILPYYQIVYTQARICSGGWDA